MPYYCTLSAHPPGVCLPYHQATAAQRALASNYLQQRFKAHFPTLRASTWSHALAEYQPDLWVTGQAVTLAQTDLTQLAQHLAAAPELPVLDPPLYGLPALQLAQHSLLASELAAWALLEVTASTTDCGPRLYALLHRLVHPSPLAEQVVQAWCWNLASAPPLPSGIQGARPLPNGAEIEQSLGRIKPPGSPSSGEAPGAFPCPPSHRAVFKGPVPPLIHARGQLLVPNA